MSLSSPSSVAIWGESGRDDSAAEVHVEPDGRVLVSSQEPLCWLALRWNVEIPEGVKILGDAWERGYGDLEWRGIAAERPLPWYALLCSPSAAQPLYNAAARPEGESALKRKGVSGGKTSGWGVKTGAKSFASWRVDSGGVTLVLDVRNGGSGVKLGGRVLEAASVVTLESEQGESAFEFARRFCRALCPSPRLPVQPVYGGNDWYHRYGKITEGTVKADAALIRALSPSRTNAPFYVIDDGWFEGRGCSGGPYVGNSDFPDLPGLASWMKSEEIRPGIWMRPLLTKATVPDSWRLSRDRTYLDPSVPEVLEQVRADISLMAGWGYELIKHDFSTFDITGRWGFQMSGSIAPDGWSFADRSKTTAEIVLKLYETIRNAAGGTYIIGCNTVGHLGAGLFELQRTGDDTSGKHWERTRKMGVNTLAFRLCQHNAFFAVDADCVGLTPGVPWEKNRLWLDALARSGTPLFVSADPAAIGPEQREALKAAFARSAVPQPPAVPLDWTENTCPSRWRFGTEEVIYDWDEFAGSALACPG